MKYKMTTIINNNTATADINHFRTKDMAIYAFLVACGNDPEVLLDVAQVNYCLQIRGYCSMTFILPNGKKEKVKIEEINDLNNWTDNTDYREVLK